jgi:peptidyl-tRNA hydrolase
LRVYAIIRGDLITPQTQWKMAAQACHCAKNVVILAGQSNPNLLRLYQGPKFLGTQVILRAKNKFALLRAQQEAESLDLITSLVVDEDHVLLPLFDGSPIITGLGIGPCTKEQAEAITKRFELVR